jgi:putative transposase
VRTAYKCRAYPDTEQASGLNRTFGCIRVVWNRTLAWRHLIVIDRWYPTCSACGHLLAGLRLSTRTWQCPSCGTRHDRDINAAKNILAAGLAVSACGADVRHPGSPRVRSAVKQEPPPVTAGIPVLQGGE